MKNNYTEYLTFDDVLLKPGYSDFSRQDINLETHLTKKIKLKSPLVAAPMDTVTESRLAIALAQKGGIGFIHRNLTIDDQCTQVNTVKKHKLLVGAAIGASKGYEKLIQALVKAKVDVVVIDSAHGYTQTIIAAIKHIKKAYPHLQIIAGNVATYEGTKTLVEAGADGIRVGMGPGAICTTRIISGMGVPQLTAIQDSVKAAKPHKVPVIADGGIKHSGDMVKALAAGASTVMMGSFFASSEEAPGNTVVLKEQQVPARFKNILKSGAREYKFKEYRGMGSIAAMKKGTEIKAEDEFHVKNYYKDRVLVAEGVEGLVPVKGTVSDIVNQAIAGIKSGFYYIGVKNIPELWKETVFIKITQASLTESHPHDILITNPGENYI